MLEKEVYQLRKENFEEYPVWYFPHDDTVEDETIVRPLTTESFDDLFDTKVFLIKADFTDNTGKVYPGCITWDPSDEIGFLQPTLFLDKEVVSFWFGMDKPDWEASSPDEQTLREKFPIRFDSLQLGKAYSRTGVLEGIYYIDIESDEVKCVK